MSSLLKNGPRMKGDIRPLVVLLLLLLLLCAAYIIGGEMHACSEGDYKHVAVMDSQGLCWLGSKGDTTSNGAILYAKNGAIRLYRPAVVISHDGKVLEKQLARLLQIDIKHCVKVAPDTLPKRAAQ